MAPRAMMWTSNGGEVRIATLSCRNWAICTSWAGCKSLLRAWVVASVDWSSAESLCAPHSRVVRTAVDVGRWELLAVSDDKAPPPVACGYKFVSTHMRLASVVVLALWNGTVRPRWGSIPCWCSTASMSQFICLCMPVPALLSMLLHAHSLLLKTGQCFSLAKSQW